MILQLIAKLIFEVKMIKKIFEVIRPEQVFPLVLILLDLAAAVVYLRQKDYKKAVYWVAAAVLNITVTF